MKHQNKYMYLYIVQCRTCLGWEDLTASESCREVRANLKEYRNNATGQYRIIKRRELNEQAQA